MGVIIAGTFLWKTHHWRKYPGFEWDKRWKGTMQWIIYVICMYNVNPDFCCWLFICLNKTFVWMVYWTGELSIRVTLQYVLSNIIISIVPNKHNRWSLITSYCQLETVTEQSSLSDPFQDPRIFKIKQTFQPFYEWSFRNVNSIFAFSVTHFWIHTKTVLFEQLGLTILTEAVRCFQWYFQYHPHHHSLSTLQTPIHPLSLYLD